MENLMQSIKHKKISGLWDYATRYPRKMPSSFWFDDLWKRHGQIYEWVTNLKTQKCFNITLLWNPISFITAV